MKVCIYGAGAIGGWIGVELGRAGCTVSVVARGATLAGLEAQGLRLQEGSETLSVPVQASASPADLGVQDLVIVAVKAPAMADVARAIGPLMAKATSCGLAVGMSRQTVAERGTHRSLDELDHL